MPWAALFIVGSLAAAGAPHPAKKTAAVLTAPCRAALEQVRTGQALAAPPLEGIDPPCARILRNAAFARHGRVFESADLRAFFRRQSWYHAKAGFSLDALSDADRANVEALRRIEEQADQQVPPPIAEVTTYAWAGSFSIGPEDIETLGGPASASGGGELPETNFRAKWKESALGEVTLDCKWLPGWLRYKCGMRPKTATPHAARAALICLDGRRQVVQLTGLSIKRESTMDGGFTYTAHYLSGAAGSDAGGRDCFLLPGKASPGPSSSLRSWPLVAKALIAQLRIACPPEGSPDLEACQYEYADLDGDGFAEAILHSRHSMADHVEILQTVGAAAGGEMTTVRTLVNVTSYY